MIREPNKNSVRKVEVGGSGWEPTVSTTLLFFILPWKLMDSKDFNRLSAEESHHCLWPRPLLISNYTFTYF